MDFLPQDQATDQNSTGEVSSGHPDLGPELHPLGQQQSRVRVMKYAWQHHRLQIVIMGLVLLALLAGVFIMDELHLPIYFLSSTMIPAANPTNWADWLINAQSVLGIGTLLVALFVWWGEIREDWENDLPKRLSIFFFYDGHPVVICRYVWLAGADELRTWGQQIAMQSAGNQRLDFSPDVKAMKPKLMVSNEDKIYMHYSVCFRLTELNQFLKEHSNRCQYQNLAGKYAKGREISFEDAESLPVVAKWGMADECKLKAE